MLCFDLTVLAVIEILQFFSILQNKNLMDKETESIYYYEYNIFDIQAGIIREQDFQEKEKVFSGFFLILF